MANTITSKSFERSIADNRPFYEDTSSPENQLISKGLVKPVRVRAQPCDSNIYIVDSKNRKSGDSFNFTVDCGVPLKALNMTITRACVPKIPNINAVNNTFSIWTQNLGTGATGSTGPTLITGVLPTGFYNQNSLQSTLKTTLDASAASAGVTDTYTVNYNAFNKTISVTSNNNNKWYWDSSCSFIKYGKYLTGFKGYSAGSDILSVGKFSNYSGIIGLLYSRYIMIKSNRLIANAMEKSRTSAEQTNVVAFISLIDQMTASDFSVSNLFNGSFILDSVVETSCNLNIAYYNKDLGPIDFQLVDEYDLPLNLSLDYGDPYEKTEFDVSILMNYIV